jgi:hypothetical protein
MQDGKRNMSATLRSEVNSALSRLFPAFQSQLKLDERGMIGLAFEDGAWIVIEVPEGSPTLFAYTALASLADGDQDDLMRRALERNLFRTGMVHGWIALDTREQKLVLCATLDRPSGVTHEVLQSFFSEILAVAASLSRDLIHHSQAAAGAEVPSDALVFKR